MLPDNATPKVGGPSFAGMYVASSFVCTCIFKCIPNTKT